MHLRLEAPITGRSVGVAGLSRHTSFSMGEGPGA